jgi:glycosyltransferase involved in cell wall biosynthesis
VSERPRVRVLRVIARMNVGGPALHVSLLSGLLDPDRYETLLVTGRVGPGEDPLEDLAERYGARVVRVPVLGPELAPLRDLRALGALVRIMRRFEPDVVHTHTAKAGTLGRLAALLSTRPRPIVVHTFHGHVLTGYFGPLVSGAYRAIEALLARVTDRLVAVSQATAGELAALGVAPRGRFEVIHVGLELEPFLAGDPQGGAAFRSEMGAGDDDVLAVYAGRLAPIKRVDVLLDGLAHARGRGAPVTLAIAGDGELRADLEARAQRLGVAGAVRFLGSRRDLAAITAGGDIAVLSSDNEGIPLALIEAAAAGLPLVATDVGGVSEIVTPDTGLLVPGGDAAALGDALADLAGDSTRRRRLGEEARERVRDRFGARRLLSDVDGLYRELLRNRGSG